MNSHDLAHLLLAGPNLPVALLAMGHTYCSDMHRTSHGKLEVLICRPYNNQLVHVLIGHMLNERRLDGIPMGAQGDNDAC